MGGICTRNAASFASIDIEIEETVFSKGGYFGEECVVSGSSHTRSIVAQGNVSLLVLSNSTFRRLCDPDDIQKADRKSSAFLSWCSFFSILNLQRSQSMVLHLIRSRGNKESPAHVNGTAYLLGQSQWPTIGNLLNLITRMKKWCA
jgi:hypothetical protein